ncbi:Major facilitator superfamily domain [Phytophthora cactorum]|nr:Major facilitator superfamily domain [Phytophthora cactorum]
MAPETAASPSERLPRLNLDEHLEPIDSSSSLIDDATTSSSDTDAKLSRTRQFCNWVQHLCDTFGTGFLVLITVVYVVQGFSSFTALAVNYFFKDNLGLQPTESQLLQMIVKVPWRVKPIYGILSDSLPLFGYHRKSYMMLCSVLQTAATLVMAVPDLVTTPAIAVLMLMLQSLCAWSLLAAALGPITTLLFSMFMEESKSTLSKRDFVSSATKQLRQLKIAICTPVVWMCALWVFISHAISPAYTQILFFFSTDVLHFSPEFLGTMKKMNTPVRSEKITESTPALPQNK